MKGVAERIRGCLRKSDFVARIGGDEFIILWPFVETEKNASGIAEKIRHALNLPFESEGLTLKLPSSSGIAIHPDHPNEQQELIERADIAVYYAKAEG